MRTNYALMEARSIVAAMKNGYDFSDVFHISPRVRQALQSGTATERSALRFRDSVQMHVDRLIKDGDVEITTVEEAETSESTADPEAVGTLQIEEAFADQETETQEKSNARGLSAFDDYEW